MDESVQHGWLYRRLVVPFLALLRMGMTPEKLAWSLALGLVVGVNPLLGTTTLLCFALAFVFRLNLAASQMTNHVVYPLQILLVVPFLRLGSRVFRTARMPLSPRHLLHEARVHPIHMIRTMWMWEWHALVLWVVGSAVMLPALAWGLTPVMRRLLAKMAARGELSSPVA